MQMDLRLVASGASCRAVCSIGVREPSSSVDPTCSSSQEKKTVIPPIRFARGCQRVTPATLSCLSKQSKWGNPCIWPDKGQYFSIRTVTVYRKKLFMASGDRTNVAIGRLLGGGFGMRGPYGPDSQGC